MQTETSERIANIIIAASLVALAYGTWRFLAAVDVTIDPWTMILAGVLVLAGALVACLFLRFEAKLNVAVLVATLFASFGIGNFVLHLTGRSLTAIIETKVVRSMAAVNRVEQEAAAKAASSRQEDFLSSRPAVSREPSPVQEALAKTGIKAGFMYDPPPLLPLIADKKIPPLLPLSSVSNTITVGCNEGDQRDFPIWHTDRYGFNNDDTVYAYPERMLIVGDSFARGSCVHQEENVASVLRRNGYPTNSVGIGGYGAIFALATLKEYGEHFKPETVLWFYFDGNDVVDLADKELRSTFLLQYLKDDFSQGLIHRQSEVDAFWKARAWATALQEFESSPERKAAWAKTLDDNLPLVRQLLGDDVASLRDDTSLVRIFGKVLAIAKRRVEAWGGKIVFVMIPNMDDYHGRIPQYRLPVINEARRLGLPIVDVDQALRATGDPLKFFPLRNQWGHFNPKGYELIARQIMAALDGLAARPGAAQVVGPVAPSPAKAAVQPQPPAPTAAAATRPPTETAKLEYKAVGTVTNVLSPDPAKATRADGASFLGYAFTPRNGRSVLRIQLRANAYSATANEVVLAVFRVNGVNPIKLFNKTVAAGGRVLFDESFDLPAGGTETVALDIRIGPAQPGTIVVNGPEGGRPAELPWPMLSITDLGAQAVAPLSAPPTRFARVEYLATATLSAVLPDDLAKARSTDGLSLFARRFVPQSEKSVLRISVAANVSSPDDNAVVLALFRAGQSSPVKLISKPLGGSDRAFVDFSVDVPVSDLSPVDFDVRIGLAKPGSGVINSRSVGDPPYKPIPFLTITDLGDQAADAKGYVGTDEFASDDGSERYADAAGVALQVGEAPMGSGRQEVDCKAALRGPKVGVFFTFGQSQASNLGNVKHASKKDVVNLDFFNMKCYRAADPLLGASNDSGSIWSRLGDRLIESGVYDRVVVIPIAVGGSYMYEWTPGGQWHRRLMLALGRLKRASIPLTAMLWQQGEAEGQRPDFPTDMYKREFLQMLESIRAAGFNVPVYAALSTKCSTPPQPPRPENIRNAIIELAREVPGVRLGPDTDTIGMERRWDACHLDGQGQDEAAELWAKVLLARPATKERRPN